MLVGKYALSVVVCMGGHCYAS